MRTVGSPAALAWRRLLAVQRITEGYSTEEVAAFLGVDPRSVRRWAAAARLHGASGLAARPVSGRPPKLSATQEKIIRRWLTDRPTEHGFATDLWTAPRLAQLIREELGVPLHPGYLSAWLRQRGYTPQKPRRKAREQDVAAVARWLAQDWPRIKKRPAAEGRACCGWTRAGC
jgi:transposase